ncbi:MAG: hypothetical protein D3903_13640 [Candidatus Electrothrix sp. GM3_4]|nr:hypothetical protein [Candidatus Electrothrix sp. GM3_4]
MFKTYYLLGSMTLFFLSGCTGLPLAPDEYPTENPDEIKRYDEEIKNHVIAIGKDGELREPLTGEEMDDPEKYLDNIVGKIKEHARNNTDGNAKLLIYIHGGLNAEAGALKRALENYRLIKANGQYPVFINWNSEGIRSYGSHLGRIRQGEVRPIRAKLTSPLYLLTDVAASLVTAPKAWFVTSEHLIDSLTFRANIDNELSSQRKIHNQNHKELVHITKGEKRSNFFRHLQWAGTIPVKVITTPFAYTLAKPAWDIMLRRTSTLFYTPCDLKKISTDSDECKPEAFSEEKAGGVIELKPGNGALYRFLSALEKGLEANTLTPKVKITLIGHSMGAIVVNDIVNLGLNLTYKNIVHMASADSIENLLNKVVPYIDCSLEGTCNNQGGKEKNDVNFYSLYLHPDNENREASGWGTIPSGSLLTWIDSMYTVPKTVLDKRSGRWDNMTRAINLIPDTIKDSMHFTIFDIEKRNAYGPDELKKLNICKPPEDCEGDKLYSTAQKHGDFGDLPFWLPEVWKGTHLPAQSK